jgi:hypothetical protein
MLISTGLSPLEGCVFGALSLHSVITPAFESLGAGEFPAKLRLRPFQPASLSSELRIFALGFIAARSGRRANDLSSAMTGSLPTALSIVAFPCDLGFESVASSSDEEPEPRADL